MTEDATGENRLGNKITTLREAHHLTSQDLADRCGCDVALIQELEAGEVPASLAPLIKITRALGVRLGTLLDDDESLGPAYISAEQMAEVERVKSLETTSGGDLSYFSLAAGRPSRHMDPFVITVTPTGETDHELVGHEGEEWLFGMEGCIEIEYGKGHYYSGGYTAYTEKKSTDREIQRRHYENQQKEIARIEAYIAQQRRWNRERNIIAAESREKQLAKLERIERPSDLPAASRMSFHESGESGNEVVLARDLCKRYGDKTLFEHLSFLIEKREHVFIYGHNGCGKSTLLRMIAERLRPDSGRVELGYNVTVGYYDQENQHLSDDKTVLDEIWDAYPSLTQNEVRGALARFLFTGDDVGKRVGVLSGGERARLTLTKLMLSEMNLLILDEPTNHLDIISREALEDALADFDGTIIAVSHDRYFISRLATRVLSFDMPPAPPLRGAASDGSIRTSGIYDHRGSYDEYVAAAAAEQRTEAESAQPAQPSEAKQQYLEAKRASQEQRRAENRIRRAKEDCARVEQRLGELEALESQLDPADYTALGELYAERESLETRLLELYEITMDA